MRKKIAQSNSVLELTPNILTSKEVSLCLLVKTQQHVVNYLLLFARCHSNTASYCLFQRRLKSILNSIKLQLAKQGLHTLNFTLFLIFSNSSFSLHIVHHTFVH